MKIELYYPPGTMENSVFFSAMFWKSNLRNWAVYLSCCLAKLRLLMELINSPFYGRICHVTITFSNSLILHQVTTKKIRILKEVWIPGLAWHRFWRFYIYIWSLVFVSIEKIYQTLETVFHWLSKHREESWKYSAQRSNFWRNSRRLNRGWNSVLSVWYIFSIETKTKE